MPSLSLAQLCPLLISQEIMAEKPCRSCRRRQRQLQRFVLEVWVNSLGCGVQQGSDFIQFYAIAPVLR